MQDAHHAGRQVAIELVVGGLGNQSHRGCPGRDLEPGDAHLHAECFGLLAQCHHTAVVVGEHHNRLAFQAGVKDALAGGEETVDVD